MEENHIGSVLSDVDIKEFIRSKDIVISPINNDNITPLGYNRPLRKLSFHQNVPI